MYIWAPTACRCLNLITLFPQIPRFVSLISVFLLTESCLQTVGASTERSRETPNLTGLSMVMLYRFFVNVADDIVGSTPLAPEVLPVSNLSTLQNTAAHKDPTHQHPEFTPPELIEYAQAADEALRLAASELVRRDATKCLADGTCADGRHVYLAKKHSLTLSQARWGFYTL